MRRIIYRKLPLLIRITTKSPGKYSINDLSEKVGLCASTIWRYSNELNLPIKKKGSHYTEEQKEFVRTHAAVMTNWDVCKALGLKYYQVRDIGKRVGVEFMERTKKQMPESEFFEHDKSGIW